MSTSGGSSGATTTQTDSIPTAKTDYQNENLNIASDIAAKPYTSYTGQRTADTSTETQAGLDVADKYQTGAPLYSSYTPATTAETKATTASYGDTLTPSDTKDWMSSYIDEALTPTLRGIDKDALSTEKKIDRGATAAGAFGDARTGVQQGENDANTALLKSDARATAYDKGYNNAVTASKDAFTANAGQYNADQKTNLTAATDLGDTLTSQGNYVSNTSKDLLAAGKVPEKKQQSELDTAYTDFTNQKEYPTEMLNVRTSADKGTPYTTTRLTTSPTSSTASGIGALSTLYGVAGKATA
jgi:hypothetical protein